MHLASGRALAAPHAVVTVPVGVLAGLCAESAIDFSPPLPGPLLEAARRLAPPRLAASTHEKVVLRWDPQAAFVAEVLGAPDAPLQIGTTDRRFHFLNLHRYGRRGQLLCHIWGDAEWEEHPRLSDVEVASAVVGALRAIFPGPPAVPEPAQFRVTRWAEDPFAAGAYSELQSVEASEADRRACAAPVGRLLFAGEAAVPAAAGSQCTHGALLSGAAAARDVIRRRGAGGATLALRLSGRGPLGLDVRAVVDLLAFGAGDGAGGAGWSPKRRRAGIDGCADGDGSAPGGGATAAEG